MMVLLGTLYDLPQFNFVKFFIVKNELNNNNDKIDTESNCLKQMVSFFFYKF